MCTVCAANPAPFDSRRVAVSADWKRKTTCISASRWFLSGTTRNRNITISGWISLMYLLAKEVISRYCSTGFLQYFAVSCGVDFLLLYKGNALFWNTSRCLVFLLHQQFFRLPQSNNTMIIRLRHINMYMYGTNNYWKWHSEYPKCNVWISEMELLEFFWVIFPILRFVIKVIYKSGILNTSISQRFNIASGKFIQSWSSYCLCV